MLYVMAGNMCSIKGKKYKLYFDKKGRRSDPTKKLGSKARYQIRVSLRIIWITIYAKDGGKGVHHSGQSNGLFGGHERAHNA